MTDLGTISNSCCMWDCTIYWCWMGFGGLFERCLYMCICVWYGLCQSFSEQVMHELGLVEVWCNHI